MPSQLIGRGTTSEIASVSVASMEQFQRIQDLFEQSFKAARVGIWVCTLPDES